MAKFVTGFVLALVSASITGAYGSKVWSWFVVPAFPGAPALGWVQVAGLSIMVAIVWPRTRIENRDGSWERLVAVTLEGVLIETLMFAMAALFALALP